MQKPSSPRRRTASIVGATLAGALAATGVGIAFAEDEVPTDTDAAAAEVAEARFDLTPRAQRNAWVQEVGEYVEADMTRRYAIGIYARLADWHAAEEYAEALATAAPSGSGSSALAAIRACESGGDYTAVSSSGTYRGAYQFDHATWQAVGGSGDPAAASPAEQDMRAQMLYDQAGSSPWPVCGQ